MTQPLQCVHFRQRQHQQTRWLRDAFCAACWASLSLARALSFSRESGCAVFLCWVHPMRGTARSRKKHAIAPPGWYSCRGWSVRSFVCCLAFFCFVVVWLLPAGLSLCSCSEVPQVPIVDIFSADKFLLHRPNSHQDTRRQQETPAKLIGYFHRSLRLIRECVADPTSQPSLLQEFNPN